MNDHERARDLVFRDRVDGLARADRQWLSSHLDGCDDCRSLVAGLESALHGLNFSPIAAPAALVSRTQLRVAERATELRRAERTFAPMRLVAGFVIVLAVLNTPLLWESVRWIAAQFAWSSYTSLAAFVAVWVAPAVVISIFLAASGAHLARWRHELSPVAEEQ